MQFDLTLLLGWLELIFSIISWSCFFVICLALRRKYRYFSLQALTVGFFLLLIDRSLNLLAMFGIFGYVFRFLNTPDTVEFWTLVGNLESSIEVAGKLMLALGAIIFIKQYKVWQREK